MTDKFTSASVIHSHLPFISNFPHFRIFHICTFSVFHAVCLNYLRIFICRKSKYIFAGESIKKRREKLMGRRGAKRRRERGGKEEDRGRKRQRESGRSKPFRSLHLHDERRLKSTRRAKKERKQQRSGFRSNFNWTHKRTHTHIHRGELCVVVRVINTS